MAIKKLLDSVLGLYLAFAPAEAEKNIGPAAPPEAPKAASSQKDCPIKHPEGSIEQAIEREIRKHDSWVSDFIEQDYTDGERQGSVSLRKIGKKTLEKLSKYDMFLAAAAYQPVDDLLLVPETEGEKRKATIDGIDHEIWHAVFDDKEGVGLLFLEGFDGPSREEIEEYAGKQVKGEEYSGLKKRILVGVRLTDVKRLSVQMQSKYMRILQSAAVDIKSIAKRIQDDPDWKKYIGEEEMGKLEKDSLGIRNDFESYQKGVIEWAKWLEGHYKEILESEGLPELEEVDGIREKMVEYNSKLSKYENIGKRLHEYSAFVRETIYKKQDTDHEKLIGELNKKLEEAKDESVKSVIKERIELQKMVHKISVDQRAMDAFMEDTSASDLIGVIEQTLTNFGHIQHMEEIEKILADPNEFMARKADALMSVYLGPVTDNKYPLSRSDLDFFERFEFNGKKMYAKSVEKYRLGLQMVADGVSPQEAQRVLEYATRFEYKGRVYEWPEADFRIKGQIHEYDFGLKEEPAEPEIKE